MRLDLVRGQGSTLATATQRDNPTAPGHPEVPEDTEIPEVYPALAAFLNQL